MRFGKSDRTVETIIVVIALIAIIWMIIDPPSKGGMFH